MPLVGNLLFSLGRVPELIGRDVDGWFLRTSVWTAVRRLRTSEETIRGFTHVGALVGGAVFLLLGLLVLLAGVVI